MRIQPVKCNTMQITQKQIKKISTYYNAEEMVTDDLKMEYMSAIFAYRLTEPLVDLQVTWS